MPRVLYLDCFAGAAGDMIIGALLDAGLPLDELRRALGSLALEGVSIEAERVSRAGVAATKFRAIERHTHSEQPGHHEHRHLSAIFKLIDGSVLSQPGKAKAKELFTIIGKAEADIHQTTLERVHLHEVGAIDSIIDVVGAVFGFEWLGVDRIVASPLNVGGGTVVCEHGTFPVPAPATAAILKGVPVYSNGPQMELVTPTGAALVTGYAQSFGPMPAMKIDRIGYGAGDRDPKAFPNVIRLLIGEEAVGTFLKDGAPPPSGIEPVVLLECEIDDMNPQLYGPLMDRLQAAGALDVYYAAIQMKKGRPGTLVSVLAHPPAREALTQILFQETTTIGVRFQEMQRERLERHIVTVETPLGAIRVKVASRNGHVLNASPEFDDCVRIAAERGVPIKAVQAAALAAYMSPGAPGAPARERSGA
jgi:uncharacterized protein (TIGR00299 family) protein